jgi:hypothetical protein
VGVLTARKKPVEMLGEDGEVAVGVVDAGVVMVRHRGGKCDLDFRADGGQDETIGEGIIRIFVGAKEEAPLGTSAGDHVVTTWHDLARESHA